MNNSIIVEWTVRRDRAMQFCGADNAIILHNMLSEGCYMQFLGTWSVLILMYGACVWSCIKKSLRRN